MRGISRDEMQGLKADGSILPAHDKEISSSKDEADGNVEISEVPDGKRRVPLFGRWQTEPWDPGSVDSISGEAIRRSWSQFCMLLFAPAFTAAFFCVFCWKAMFQRMVMET